MLNTGAGARRGSEGSSDKDLDPRVLPVSRAVWGQGYMWAAPGSSAHSFPSPLARRRLRALHQEGVLWLDMSPCSPSPLLRPPCGRKTDVMNKVRKKLTPQGPF